MKVSVLLVDCTDPRPDDGYYVIRECELQGDDGEYFVIDSNGIKIPVSDSAFLEKRINFEKSIFGDVDWIITLRIGAVDESKPDDYKSIGLNLNDFK